jgi:hypothetical protein
MGVVMDPAADDRASRFETSNARFEAVQWIALLFR